MIDERKLIEEIEKEISGVIVKDTYSKGKNAGLRKARIFAEEQPKIREWIPCSERLPEKKNRYQKREEVLVTYQSGIVGIAQYEFESMDFWEPGDENHLTHWQQDENDKVIAWQPLPIEYQP